jgi:hypothetical protein
MLYERIVNSFSHVCERSLRKEGYFRLSSSWLPTYDQSSNGQVPPIEHPKGPYSQSTVTSGESQGEKVAVQDIPKHRSIVAFIHACYHNGKMEIVQLSHAYADCIFETVTKQEESGSVV